MLLAGRLIQSLGASAGGTLSNAQTRTHVTSLAERVTDVGPKIWFTQGGGMLADYADSYL